MRIKLDHGAKLPTKARNDDAGWDLYSLDEGWVMAGHRNTFRTGVHIELPRSVCGLLVAKSGLNVQHGITSTGLIDPGYSGEIIVALQNHSHHDYHVKAGDKITQLVLIPVVDVNLVEADEVNAGERGNAGIGSSGR